MFRAARNQELNGSRAVLLVPIGASAQKSFADLRKPSALFQNNLAKLAWSFRGIRKDRTESALMSIALYEGVDVLPAETDSLKHIAIHSAQSRKES